MFAGKGQQNDGAMLFCSRQGLAGKQVAVVSWNKGGGKIAAKGVTKGEEAPMERILLLEDDAALGRGVAMALERPARTVERVETLAGAQSCLAQTRYDLLILDINLPDGSGLKLLRTLRAGGDCTPVIVLTANDLEIDEVTGLEAGADDYITKPFSLAVLRARVDAQLRRRADRTDNAVLAIGPFRFDFARMEFRRAGELVELSKTEQKLLRVLVDNRGHAVSRAVLLDRVWTDGAAFVEENALSVAVGRLRAKLEDDPARPQYLKTVYGIGYTWAVKP